MDSHDLFSPIMFEGKSKHYICDELDLQKSIHSFIEEGKKAFTLKQKQISNVYDNWGRLASLLQE